MSLLLSALVVGCGVLVGRLIAQSPRARGQEAPPSEPPTPAPRPQTRLEGFPCQLGDVVMRSVGDEAWLAGALVLSEGDVPAAVLFLSPEAAGLRGVLARPQHTELLWLNEERSGVVAIGGEPPTSLEVGGERYERRRRLPFHVERRGSGAPDLGDSVVFAEYTGLGDSKLVVLAGKEATFTLRGEALVEGTYDVLPGDKET